MMEHERGGAHGTAIQHGSDPLSGIELSKHHEHHDLLSLVPTDEADAVAIRSGLFAAESTWADGRVPTEGSFVHVPGGLRVEIASSHLSVRIDRMRVDGELVFSSSATTGLKVTTLVVGDEGVLRIGSAAAPIARERPATILIGDRGPRDQLNDPSDMTGGLLCQGTVEIYGEALTTIAEVIGTPMAGDDRFRLAERPNNWRVGDELLVPGTSFRQEEDEVVRIVALGEDGSVVRFEPALRYDRWIPEEVSSRLPIGNMTRSVLIRSETPELERRGHIMLMHRETGHVIEYARLEDLGRTRAAVAHTIPTRDGHGGVIAGSDDNTIGRYALHFHIRNGASRGLPPHLVEGCAIIDSPKHGLVNHGGNVVARENVTFRIAGSHFFTENSTEMGAFVGNLAVRSAGAGDRTLSREGPQDFGHGGHGFWMQGPLIEVRRNYAFGHAESAFAYRCTALEEGGELVWIRADQVTDPEVIAGQRLLKPQGIPISFSDNTAVASDSAFVFWDVMSNPKHDQWCVVSDCQGWSIGSRGLWIPYVSQTEFRDIVLIRDREGFGGVGVLDNRTAHDLRFENMHIAGFSTGIRVPKRGGTEIRQVTLANQSNIAIQNAERHGRRVLVEDPSFVSYGGVASEFDYEFAPVEVPQSGNIAAMLLRSEIIVRGDERLEGRQLYSREQVGDHVPVTVSKNPEIDGRTNRELWEAHRLALYGSVAPADASPVRFSNGLVGSPAPHARVIAADAWPEPLQRTGEPQYQAEPGQTEGWVMSSVEQSGEPTTPLYYIDATPGFVELEPRMPRAVHPDDLRYGMAVRVFMYDKVGDSLVAGNGVNYVSAEQIEVKDGTAIVPYTVCDRAGHEETYYYRFEVTEDAPRRLRNISYFLQASQVGDAAEQDTHYGPFKNDDARYSSPQEEYDGDDQHDGHDGHP